MKLTWRKCPCNWPSCDRWHPVEIGFFYQGTGFDSKERVLIDRAFEALENEPEQRSSDTHIGD